jgi:hypothetical protein
MLETYHRVERLATGEASADVDNFWAYADMLTSRLALGKIKEAEEAKELVFDIAPADSPYALELLASLDCWRRSAGQVPPRISRQ